MMVGYPYTNLEELLSKLTPESYWILCTSSWRLEVEDFVKERRARLSCPPRGPWLPLKWKPKPIISREAQIDLLNKLEHCLDDFNKKGHMSPRIKIAMERLYFDRTLVLLGFQVVLGECKQAFKLS